jgi:hypothetical protein
MLNNHEVVNIFTTHVEAEAAVLELQKALKYVTEH